VVDILSTDSDFCHCNGSDSSNLSLMLTTRTVTVRTICRPVHACRPFWRCDPAI